MHEATKLQQRCTIFSDMLNKPENSVVSKTVNSRYHRHRKDMGKTADSKMKQL